MSIPGKKEQVKRASVILLSLFFAGFLLIAGVSAYISSLINGLDHQRNNELARVFVGELIIAEIRHIEIDLYQLAITTSPVMQRHLAQEIHDHEKDLKKFLAVLQYGGVASQRVNLNILGINEVIREMQYAPEANEPQPIAVIEMAPFIDKIHESTGEILGLIEERNACRDKDLLCIKNSTFAVKERYRLLPPFFLRLHEDANRLFFESDAKLNALEKNIERQKTLLRYTQIGLVIAVVLSVMGMALFYIRRINVAHRALDEARVLAETANTAKSQFLANVSHEIRTPLNGIVGMTELTLHTHLNEQQRRYLNVVKSSSDSLLALINDILDFSKIEANKLQLEEEAFDPRLMLSQILRLLSISANQKGIELIADISPDLPGQLVGDPEKIRQILINLLGNAIKFTEAGEVSLHVSCSPGANAGTCHLRFSVSDTGIGIDPEKHALIFESFNQGDLSTTRRFGGTGLGLSICKKLVELMGGKIGFESKPGYGSTFFIEGDLPVAQERQREALRQNFLLGRRVLLVEDGASPRFVLARLLEAGGAEVISAPGAVEALAIVSDDTHRIDALIVDAHMPGMDGFALIRQMRSASLDEMPVVMMILSDQHEDVELCSELGITAFVHKPVLADELFEALRHLLDTEGTTIEKPALTAEPESVEAQSSLRILLVEDNVVNQEIAMAFLKKEGYRVQIATNGKEALDLLKSESFDAVLMDVQMPVMSGIEATRYFRKWEVQENRTHTPIIGMTASAMKTDVDAFFEAGMDEHISKPVDWSRGMSMLGALCNQGSLANLTGHEDTSEKAGFFENVMAFDPRVLQSMPLIAEGGNSAFVEKMLAMFIKNTAETLEAMDSAASQGDRVLLYQLAHTLKSTSATIGAPVISAKAAFLEALYSRDHTPSLSDLKGLQEAYGDFVHAVDNHLHSARGADAC